MNTRCGTRWYSLKNHHPEVVNRKSQSMVRNHIHLGSKNCIKSIEQLIFKNGVEILDKDNINLPALITKDEDNKEVDYSDSVPGLYPRGYNG